MGQSGMINGVAPYGPYSGTYQAPQVAYFNGVMDLTDDEDVTEPVTLPEAKLFTRITTTTEDALITALITTARMAVEKFLNINVFKREISVVLNNPLGGIYFPYGPVEVDSIVLKDAEGNTIDADNITITGTTWPQLLWPQYNRITATYNAGYAVCPELIKTAIKEEVTFLYRNRGEEELRARTGTVEVLGLSSVAKTLLKPIRRAW